MNACNMIDLLPWYRRWCALIIDPRDSVTIMKEDVERMLEFARKRSAHVASRLPIKSAVDVDVHCVLEFKNDSPIWEGSLCVCCQKSLNGQRLK